MERPHHLATYPVVSQCRRFQRHIQHRILYHHCFISRHQRYHSFLRSPAYLNLSTPLEKTGNDFGVELPEEINSDLRDITVTQEMIEKADTLKEMNLPKGTLVMIVKRGDEFLIPNGSLKLHVNDKLLLISEKKE